MVCAGEHLELDATVKASLKDGKYFLCVIVWCRLCGVDFEVTDNIEKSLDERQVLIEVQPARLLISNVSSANN